MNKFFLIIGALLLSLTVSAQNWSYGLVHNGDHSFSVVAVPNFTGEVDASDMGFTLIADIGHNISIDVNNLTDKKGSNWTVKAVTSETLSSVDVGNGDKDAYIFNRIPQQLVYDAFEGTPFTVVTFKVLGAPTSGTLELAANNNSLILDLESKGFGARSFYNANIGQGTREYFQSRVPGQEKFDFSPEASSDVELTGITMYPNPADTSFVIRGLEMSSDVTIHDMNGKLVMSKMEYENGEINVSQLQTGLYFVNISNDGGNTTKKLIVE